MKDDERGIRITFDAYYGGYVVTCHECPADPGSEDHKMFPVIPNDVSYANDVAREHIRAAHTVILMADNKDA